MSREPNAILAINSLDRYINTNVPTLTYFDANWGDAALNITIKQVQPYGANRPRIGSALTAGNLSLVPNSVIGAPVVTDIQYTTQNGSSILAGGIYTVLSLGDTDWAFIGAGSATPAIGFVFQAINNGIGNGSVKWVNIAYISKPTIALQTQFASVTQWTFSKGGAQQPVSSLLYSEYNRLLPYSNNFTIESPGALIYGYIKYIVVSQIQLQYNIPTINFGLNDTFVLKVNVDGTQKYKTFQIPYGFYYPSELAAILQTIIRADAELIDMLVTFSSFNGFTFRSLIRAFEFVDPTLLPFLFIGAYSDSLIACIYKTYKVLGMSVKNSVAQDRIQTSTQYPNFLYTPYIDIYSDILTNYQNVKDTNTSIAKPKGLIARVYLSGTGNLQDTTDGSALGSRSFVVTADLNSPKIIRWNPDVAVPSIDFQMRDCYGDLLPSPIIQANNVVDIVNYYQTEFQMTLLCSEGNE